MTRITLVLLPLLALSATSCTSDDIVLKDPVTGQVHECRANSGASISPLIQNMLDNSATQSCAKGFQAAGWVRMN